MEYPEEKRTREEGWLWKFISERRNLIGFWFLGMCNNISYIVMLSSAYDILSMQKTKFTRQVSNVTITRAPPTIGRTCNPMSTGAILLADILPCLFVRLTAAFYIHSIHYRIRVPVCIFFSAASFLIVASSVAVWMSVLGVVCASICFGLGELTFLSLTALYERNTLATWSSGTGGAAIFGALSYAGLTSVGLTPRHAILVMLFVPIVMSLSYYVILTSSNGRGCSEGDKIPLLSRTELTPRSSEVDGLKRDSLKSNTIEKLEHQSDQRDYVSKLSTLERLKLIPPLYKYMIPLFLVYFAEYYINQALFELVTFRNINWLSIGAQYRWYQVSYQLGVFISRSSGSCCRTKKIWIFPALQLINATFFTIDAVYMFVPFWLVCCIILYEGLLGGSAYVNSFIKLSDEAEEKVREFSLGVASVADTMGICLAGFVAIPVHNKICTLPDVPRT